MAGMGLEGAYGAQGTFEGLKEWMRGQRQKVVQGQQDTDRLREQRLKDEALATEAANREYDIARQRALDAQNATDFGNRQTIFGHQTEEWKRAEGDRQKNLSQRDQLLADLDALDDPSITPFRRNLARYEIETTGKSTLLDQMAKPLEPDYVVAPNGELIDRTDPKNRGRNFAAPHEPRQAADRALTIAPNGQVIDLHDRSNLGKTYSKPVVPKGANLSGKQRDTLSRVYEGRQILAQLKPLFDGDADNPDPAKRWTGAKEFVGPWEGWARGQAQKYGMGPVQKTFAKFKAASARGKNATIQAITGAAVGVDETKRLLDEIPTELDPPELWPIKWAQAMKNLDYIEEGILGQPGGGTIEDNPMDSGDTGGGVVIGVTHPRGRAAGQPPRGHFDPATGEVVW